MRSLGRLKNARAIAPVAACLAHEQANLRKEAAAALGEIADPAAEPYLDAVRDDPDPDVRKNVRWALAQISARRAVGS